MTTPQYWSTILEQEQDNPSMGSWRKHMRDLYRRCLDQWLPDTGGRALKTDLFEEGVSAFGLLETLGSLAVGLDCSPALTRFVKHKQPAARVVACDLRSLPYRSESFRRILSGSSLDHFEKAEDVDTAIQELARVMEPGGVLFITFDNPTNPLIWLRNHLPFGLLHSSGLVPYYVGPTCSASEARKKLERAGLKVTDSAAVLHVPRAPAIWIVRLLHRMGSHAALAWFEKHMMAWERLQRWPTSHLTGYYVALRAVKPAE